MAPDPLLVAVLEDLQLLQYIRVCDEQDVDYKTFLHLDDCLLKELIPNIDHRIKVMKWIKMKNCADATPIPVLQLGQESTSGNITMEKTSLAVNVEESVSETQMSKIENLSNASTIDSCMETGAKPILEASNTSQVDTLDLTPPTKKAKQENFVSRPSCIHPTNIFGDRKTLQQFLQSSKTGRALLAIYNANKHFNNLERARIVHMVGDKLCEENERVSNEQFAQIAKELVGLFPTETSGVYFVSAEGACSISSGKIVDQFRNQKKIIIKSRKQNAVPEKEPDPELELKLEWLKCNARPWKKVECWWEDTRPIRSSKCPIISFIKLFPALQMPLGYRLLESDFLHQHPGKNTALLSHWSSLAPKLWSTLQLKHKATLKGSYTDHLDKNVSDLHLLRALPSALPCPVHCVSKSTFWKPSFSEAQDGFILVVENEADLPAALQQRRDKLLNLGLRARAIITAVCPQEDVFASCQLHIDTVKYEAPYLLRALDLGFKLSMALNTEHNFETGNIFLFMQRFIYGIETSHDKMTSSISNLIGELQME